MLHSLLNCHFTCHFLTRFDSSQPSNITWSRSCIVHDHVNWTLACGKGLQQMKGFRPSASLPRSSKTAVVKHSRFQCLVRKVQVFLESNQGISNVGEESFWTYWMRPNATSKAKMPQFTLLADFRTHSMPVSNSTARPKCLTCAYCCTVGKIIGFYLLILA